MKRGLVIVLGSLVVVACGGASKDAGAPASAPSSGAPSSNVAPAADQAAPPAAGYAEPGAAAAPVNPATIAPAPAPPEAGRESAQPSDSSRRREAALRSARAEVNQAEKDLEASATDCVAACRALASMERATGHLCDLATLHDDRRFCEDAKTKVLAARDRIRSACGTCANGPTLEHSAPIPSGT